MNKPQWIILHTEAAPVKMDAPRFAVVNEYHRQQFDFKSSLGFYCGYHYFIEKNGKIIQARADTDEGAHTKGYNSVSLGICLAGNGDVEMPIESQKQALGGLIGRKMVQFGISKENIVPHRHFLAHKEKTCYGRLLSNEWARNLITAVTPVTPPPAIPSITQQLSAIQKALNWIAEQITKLRTQKVGGVKDFDHL